MSNPCLNELVTPNIMSASESSILPSNDTANGFEIIYQLAAVQTYPPGAELFGQGSSAYEVYFIDRGLVKLNYVGTGGHE